MRKLSLLAILTLTSTILIPIAKADGIAQYSCQNRIDYIVSEYNHLVLVNLQMRTLVKAQSAMLKAVRK